MQAAASLTISIWNKAGEADAIPRDESDLAERLAPHIQHVATLCEQGYQAGEIVDDEFSGWWTITRVA